MIQESDIIYQNKSFWVTDFYDKSRYTIMRDMGCHSVDDSAYPHDVDGLSLAKARCDYLASRS